MYGYIFDQIKSLTKPLIDLQDLVIVIFFISKNYLILLIIILSLGNKTNSDPML
ncbi:hypothetical protein Lalb_Chr09g0330251 [Lupinus albus]|uniref:Uncharacterized protein n=1 Tax=Lupinus albus TaxID=3870 RepID=A0A6A4Q1H0_LUPAL|nr:hypothetical protein Lalb_Chr09g0330251 [Lupinus albus]